MDKVIKRPIISCKKCGVSHEEEIMGTPLKWNVEKFREFFKTRFSGSAPYCYEEHALYMQNGNTEFSEDDLRALATEYITICGSYAQKRSYNLISALIGAILKNPSDPLITNYEGSIEDNNYAFKYIKANQIFKGNFGYRCGTVLFLATAIALNYKEIEQCSALTTKQKHVLDKYVEEVKSVAIKHTYKHIVKDTPLSGTLSDLLFNYEKKIWTVAKKNTIKGLSNQCISYERLEKIGKSLYSSLYSSLPIGADKLVCILEEALDRKLSPSSILLKVNSGVSIDYPEIDNTFESNGIKTRTNVTAVSSVYLMGAIAILVARASEIKKEFSTYPNCIKLLDEIEKFCDKEPLMFYNEYPSETVLHKDINKPSRQKTQEQQKEIKQPKKETQMSNFKNANKKSITLALKLEGGSTVITVIKSLLKKSKVVPMMARGYLDHPIADVLIANALNMAATQIPTDSRIKTLADLAMDAAYVNTAKSFNIQEAISNLIEDASIQKLLETVGSEEAVPEKKTKKDKD